MVLRRELNEGIRALSWTTYTAFNDTRFTEKLTEIERIAVSRDTVRLGGMVIDIPEKAHRRGYNKAKMKPDQPLDGSWRVQDNDTPIAHTDPASLPGPIRAKPRRKSHVITVSDEPWFYRASAG